MPVPDPLLPGQVAKQASGAAAPLETHPLAPWYWQAVSARQAAQVVCAAQASAALKEQQRELPEVSFSQRVLLGQPEKQLHVTTAPALDFKGRAPFEQISTGAEVGAEVSVEVGAGVGRSVGGESVGRAGKVGVIVGSEVDAAGVGALVATFLSLHSPFSSLCNSQNWSAVQQVQTARASAFTVSQHSRISLQQAVSVVKYCPGEGQQEVATGGIGTVQLTKLAQHSFGGVSAVQKLTAPACFWVSRSSAVAKTAPAINTRMNAIILMSSVN